MSLDRYRVKKTKHEYQWQEEAEKLTKHFKTNCFWVFHKFDSWWINKAYTHCVEKNKPFGYFLGLLNGYSLNSEKMIEKIRILYTGHKKNEILLTIKKFGWKLDEKQKIKIMESISSKKALEEMREAYKDQNYYEVKRLLRTKGWLLTKDKYSDIINSIERIKPSKLIDHAQEVMGKD